jgi:phage host-nuclease inhibitor protein Gam
MKRLGFAAERVRLRVAADALSDEIADRATFRTTLMTEISSLRHRIKDCEAERDDLRNRTNVAEGQVLVLKATNEIMTRWVKFFRNQNYQDASVPPLLPDLPTECGPDG